MTNKITQKIIGYKVKTASNVVKEVPLEETLTINVTDKIVGLIQEEHMPTTKGIHEKVSREPILEGKTYKFKPSNSEHSYYVTINDILIETSLYPFEIFVNSKGIEHFQFLGLARVISGVFRKGGDSMFLVDELKAIYDHKGPYTSSRKYPSGKRKRFNSIEAEIGDIIEEHLLYLEDRNNWDAAMSSAIDILTDIDRESIYDEPPKTGFPPNAIICSKCSYKAVVMSEGCLVCLNCSDSKCN